MEDGLTNSMGLPFGKHVRIYDAYVEARQKADAGLLSVEEAMSTSDFPTYISKLIRHTFLGRFNEIQGVWTQYTRALSVEDFEDYTSGRFADIPEKSLNGEYDQLAIKEFPAETVRLREWGAGFGLTRQLIISDRLNKMAELPTLLAEALARTMSKEAAINQFQSNPTMFDGNALFSAAHGNLTTTALTPDATGRDTVKTLDLKFDDITDDEGFTVIGPGQRTLLIPPELRYVAKAINENELLVNGSSQLEANLVRGLFSNVVIEPYFTDANNWYVLSDPTGEFAPLVRLTLNGNTTPFVGLKDPGVRAVLGGNDPYSFDFDEIKYKIRHDFAFKPIEWRGVQGAIVP
jgi:hypothetical protein